MLYLTGSERAERSIYILKKWEEKNWIGRQEDVIIDIGGHNCIYHGIYG